MSTTLGDLKKVIAVELKPEADGSKGLEFDNEYRKFRDTLFELRNKIQNCETGARGTDRDFNVTINEDQFTDMLRKLVSVEPEFINTIHNFLHFLNFKEKKICFYDLTE